MLPTLLEVPLRQHRSRVRALHTADLKYWQFAILREIPPTVGFVFCLPLFHDRVYNYPLGCDQWLLFRTCVWCDATHHEKRQP